MNFKSSGVLIAFFTICFFTLSSCKDPNMQTATINNEYSVDIPRHFIATDELNTDASLQYKDSSEEEEYIIVIDEPKGDFIKNFSEDTLYGAMYDKKVGAATNYRIVEMAMIKDRMETKSGPHIKKTTINGLDAEIVDFVSKPGNIDEDIYYKVAFIEGKKNLYMVMAWTLATSKDKYDAEMEKMLNSFRLTN